MTVALIVLGSLCLVTLIYVYLLFPSRRKHKDLKLIEGKFIAHRGLHGLCKNAPENSLEAFRRAVEHGFPIEIDIHLTADGKIVVFHDDFLDRICKTSGRVEDKTLAELKALSIADTDCKIPTLQECLDTVAGKVPLLIEFKCRELRCDKLCETANKILSRYKGKYLIQSFYPTVLKWYRKHRKDICRGQLAATFRGDELYKHTLGYMPFNFLSRPDFVSFNHVDAKWIPRRMVTSFGAYPVGWTFQSQDELDKSGKYFKTHIFEGFVPKK